MNYTDTVQQLQLKIFQEASIPPNEQMIFFGTEKLVGNKTLGSYNITSSSELKVTRTDPQDTDDFSGTNIVSDPIVFLFG